MIIITMTLANANMTTKHQHFFSQEITESRMMQSSKNKSYTLFFEKTLTEFHPMISRLISSYEYIPALQEELYQEISVALWKALARFDNQSSLKTYLLSIAHKRAVSHVAKHVREPRRVDVEDYHLGEAGCPSEIISTNQKMNRLVTGLRQLPLVDRQLVTLALEGLSYKDIAEILGLSVVNIGVKLNRAKTKLNSFLSVEADYE